MLPSQFLQPACTSCFTMNTSFFPGAAALPSLLLTVSPDTSQNRSKNTRQVYPSCLTRLWAQSRHHQGCGRSSPGLWVPPKWHSNRPTIKSSIKNMEEWCLKKKHKAKEVSQNKGGNEENTWKGRHQGCSDREDAKSEHRSWEQGQQLKQMLKYVGRASTSKERVCKKP